MAELDVGVEEIDEGRCLRAVIVFRLVVFRFFVVPPPPFSLVAVHALFVLARPALVHIG